MQGFMTNFVWGAAAAAFQIEGASFEDDKGWSVWDMMCRKKNTIWENHTGDIACDHYHRYKEDVSFMQQIGIRGYRTSVSWPRVIPNGIGVVNEKGLDFYDHLVDTCLAAGVQPWITLFHWDYPYELYCRGGWLNPDSPQWFAEYTGVVVDRLSDRVTNWVTMNEPQCFIGQGLYIGIHAPGDRLGLKPMLRAGHHALLAHGRSVQVIKSRAKTPATIGYAPVGVIRMPAQETEGDIQAARSEMFSMRDESYWNNTWWTDPIFLGCYPEDGLSIYGDNAPKFTDQEMKIISEPVDFCGANIYNGRETSTDKSGCPIAVDRSAGYPMSTFNWPVTPQCLYWGPKFYYERYGKPIVITENGMTNVDWVSLDGKVHDPQRIDFLHRYLLQLRRAANEGVPIWGYFQWSLTDNFEWAEGFSKRFGLIHVDYATQKRTLKDSAYWYRDVIATNGQNL